MTTSSTTPVAPEVRLFLARVRAELADLDPDDLADITDGLEADLGELVAERGPASLGDPVEYADELRRAAGIPERSITAPQRRGVGERVTAVLDAAHRRADAVIDALPGEPRPLLAWLRPLWWIVRGASFAGAWGYANYRWDLGVFALAVVGAVASVLVGRGKIWPGARRSTTARVVLVLINLVAIWTTILSVAAVQERDSILYDRGYAQVMSDVQRYPGDVPQSEQAGIYADGRWVSQVFPYDAAGNPLTGVQLFDQVGKPIKVVTQPECESAPEAKAPPISDPAEMDTADCYGVIPGEVEEGALQTRIYYPWSNGAAQLYNVFPLPSRFQDTQGLSPTAFTEETKPAVAAWPFATVPPVSLPGIATSELTTPGSR